MHDYCKLTTIFQHSLNDLTTAIHTLKDNPVFDKSYITVADESDRNKNYISSLIKVLKDIGWLAQCKNCGKYIRIMNNDINSSST
jgi:hypothetical protein